MEKFVFAIGIRHVGETTSRILAKEFLNINIFIKNCKNKDRLLSIDGLGPKAIESIINYFNNKTNLLTVIQLT